MLKNKKIRWRNLQNIVHVKNPGTGAMHARGLTQFVYDANP